MEVIRSQYSSRVGLWLREKGEGFGTPVHTPLPSDLCVAGQITGAPTGEGV
jgi:hypothetical protein